MQTRFDGAGSWAATPDAQAVAFVPQFLSGLVRAEPDWSSMQHPHAADPPALRWKLANLETFRKRRPAAFRTGAEALDAGLNRVGALR